MAPAQIHVGRPTVLRMLRIPEGFLSRDETGHVVLRFSDHQDGSQCRPLEDFFGDLVGKRVLISVKMEDAQEDATIN